MKARSTESSPYDDFGEARIKHLELVQAVIDRLGTNGFLVKGWALTAAGIFLGVSVQTESWELAVVSLLPTLGFWGLDAYFLRCERLFRHLYDRIRVGEGDVAPFYMSATMPAFVSRAPRRITSSWTTFWRPSLTMFYGSIVLATAAVFVFTFLGAGQPSNSEMNPSVAPASTAGSSGLTAPNP